MTPERWREITDVFHAALQRDAVERDAFVGARCGADVDLQSIDALTDFYLGCGVHGFTLLGMMGEAPKLNSEESLSVVNRVIGRAQGRQVIVGVSHAGLENVRRLSHEVMVVGSSGVMIQRLERRLAAAGRGAKVAAE